MTSPDAAAFGFALQPNTAPGVPVPEVIDSVTPAEPVVTLFPDPFWSASFGCAEGPKRPYRALDTPLR